MPEDPIWPQVKAYVQAAEFCAQLGLDEPVQLEYLAQGEYNRNYLLTSGDKKYVLRLNIQSQLGLTNQIKYEFQTILLLQDSGVTPQVYFVDDSLQKLPYGILVMEYLPGRPLDYSTDLAAAAKTLARIHSLDLSRSDCEFLIKDPQPFGAILKESAALLQTYLDFPEANLQTAALLQQLFALAKSRQPQELDLRQDPCLVVINTELNNRNFIINPDVLAAPAAQIDSASAAAPEVQSVQPGQPGHADQPIQANQVGSTFPAASSCHLVDWEKPIYGEPAQDLSHFLLITTTLWKTSYVISAKERQQFLQAYIAALDPAHPLSSKLAQTITARVKLFDTFTLLRALAWCAMAWTGYKANNRPLTNQDTYQKIEQYLNPDFLDKILQQNT